MQKAIHLLAEIYGAQHLTDSKFIKNCMARAAEAAGATVLNHHFHHFTGGGVTGVLLLAESHMSIHTWPEHNYAALDVFMCGRTQPRIAADQVCKALLAERFEIREIERCIIQTTQPSPPDNIVAIHGFE